MLWQAAPDDIGMSVSYPLPGTRFHEAVKAQLGERQNWIDSDDLAMLYQGPYITAFYRQLHTSLHREYRLRRLAWRLSRRLTRPRNPIQRRAPKQAISLRDMLAALYYALMLPVDRVKLRRLERWPHQGLAALPPLGSPMDPSRPTPQAGE
jgi:hypothetical protein